MNTIIPRSKFEIRARHDDISVRVYQAFSPEIAVPAAKAGRFVPPFKLARMTWIKPSFNWMMYRSGFATKPGQEHILAIDISRDGFEWALGHAVLSAFDPSVHSSHDDWCTQLDERPVRVQWDPERDWRLNSIDGVRAIQIGLAGEAVHHYVNAWVLHIEDVTTIAHAMALAAKMAVAPPDRPDQRETIYALGEEIRKRIVPNTKFT